MGLRLSVNRNAWQARVEAVAATFPNLIPVVKGNGYGFGRAVLMPIAAALSDRIAVGTVDECGDVPADRIAIVLTPHLGPLPSAVPRTAHLTVGSSAHVASLQQAGWTGSVLIKLRSSMQRYGVTPAGLPSLAEAVDRAGMTIGGYAIHLPLSGTQGEHLDEVVAWLPHLDPQLEVAVSHLDPATYAALVAAHPDHRFAIRLGTALWHGDKSQLSLTADVLDVSPVAAGDTAGYRGSRVDADGHIVLVAAGSAHGVQPLDDGLSPFHFRRTRLSLIEPPHMHTSMVFVPEGASLPDVGDRVDVQRPLIATSVDDVDWGEPSPAGATPPDVDAQPRPRRRLPGLDVTRAVALIGVVIMNYHGYLNGGDDGVDRSYAERIFDPYNGPFATRFAATFVLVAGMGLTLLTNGARVSEDRREIAAARWRLVRRGFILYSFGLLIEWVWHGTILFYYGAFFMVGALLFRLRTRTLAAIGVAAALAGAGIAWFRIERSLDGRSTAWLDPPIDSPRNLVLRTFVGYTHPLLPWLAFFCAGIILGRLLPRLATLRPRLIAIGLAMFAASYAVNYIGLRAATDQFTSTSESASRWRELLSTAPFDRGLLYTIGTLGSSVIAFCVISWIADRFPTNIVTTVFAHAGQMTLTLYVCHVLVYNLVVHWLGWVRPTGLDTALVFSLVFWFFAIELGAFWHRFVGAGPLERVYRTYGG